MERIQRGERIVIVGDLFPTDANVSYFASGDIESLFGPKIIDLFQRASLTICNLEGSLTNHCERSVKTGPVKVAPPEAVTAYKKLGINYCMLANNHITDGGHQGVLDTMDTLGHAGIRYIGAGRNQESIVKSMVIEVGGLLIGFYNVSETMYNRASSDKSGAWLYDEYLVCKEIEELKGKCDYLIVIYHGGIEKFPFPSPEIRTRFHRMADSGANIVIAQHTHCVGCEEHYNNSWLLYGQGDFLLKNFLPGFTDNGFLIELVVRDGNVNIIKHRVKSVDNLFVRYDENQDLSDFDLRSQQLKDEQYVTEQLRLFCSNELRLYLSAFKSPSRARLLEKRLFPRRYDEWLFHYRKRDLLFTLHTLRSEQNRETAIIGLEQLING